MPVIRQATSDLERRIALTHLCQAKKALAAIDEPFTRAHIERAIASLAPRGAAHPCRGATIIPFR